MISLRAMINSRHILAQWQKISGYAERQLRCRGQEVDLITYDIPCRDARLDGRTILFFSDLHWNGDNQTIGKDILHLTAQVEPDWLVFGGDLVSYSCHLESALQLLSVMHARNAAIAAPGNWDKKRWRWMSRGKWDQLLRQAGFVTLCNEEYRQDGIRFWGTDDYKLGVPDYRRPDLPACSVVIAHNPDSIVDFEADMDSIDLLLCGHTHAGQIRLPLLGAFRTSSIYWRKFDYGHYIHRRTGTHLLISSGLGNTFIDLRCCCRREMVQITLRATC